MKYNMGNKHIYIRVTAIVMWNIIAILWDITFTTHTTYYDTIFLIHNVTG